MPLYLLIPTYTPDTNHTTSLIHTTYTHLYNPNHHAHEKSKRETKKKGNARLTIYKKDNKRTRPLVIEDDISSDRVMFKPTHQAHKPNYTPVS